jgi:hypothetical protein
LFIFVLDMVCVHTSSLTPPVFIEMSVPSQEIHAGCPTAIGVASVYIDTGSPVLYIPLKSRDLADENNKMLTELK